jgi:hypothetical protein
MRDRISEIEGHRVGAMPVDDGGEPPIDDLERVVP